MVMAGLGNVAIYGRFGSTAAVGGGLVNVGLAS